MADEGRKEMKSTDTHIAAALPPRFDKCPEASQSVGTRQSVHPQQSRRWLFLCGGRKKFQTQMSIYPLFFFFYFYLSLPASHAHRLVLVSQKRATILWSYDSQLWS